MVAVLNAGLEQIFERYDAILTPSAPGEAPAGLDATGNPIFCSMWTYVGLPAISMPLLEGGTGLPIGVQMVGARHGDARLLRNARWLAILSAVFGVFPVVLLGASILEARAEPAVLFMASFFAGVGLLFRSGARQWRAALTPEPQAGQEKAPSR